MQKHSFGQYEPNPLEEQGITVGVWCREQASGRRTAMLATAPSRLNECALWPR